MRDAKVLIDTFERLRYRCRAILHVGRPEQIQRGLKGNQRHVTQTASAAVARARGMLTRVRRSLPALVEQAASVSNAQRGLQNGYERSRTALANLTPLSGAADIHKWRRRLKTHWYHVRLFEGLHPTPRSRAESLQAIETELGDDHNLALLAEELLAHPRRFGGTGATAVVLGCIQQQQVILRRNAVTRGRRLFSRMPRQFGKTLRSWGFHQ